MLSPFTQLHNTTTHIGKTIYYYFKMELLSFPPEIQLQVLRNSVAADFENLVVSCKSLHSLVASLIEEHNKQRMQYRTLKLEYNDAQSYSWGRSVPEILYKIAQDPELARYVVHVDLLNQQTVQDTKQDGGAEWFTYNEGEEYSKAEVAIRGLLQSSDYVSQINPSAEFADEWLRRILGEGADETVEDGVDYSTLFLLTLLPNIETLALGNRWSQFSDVETVLVPEEGTRNSDEISRSAPELMELIIKRANDETLRGQSLAKLRILYPTRDIEPQGGDDMVTVMPFLALNSLREFHHESGWAMPKVKPENDACCSFHMYEYEFPGRDSGSHDDSDGSETGSQQDDQDEREGSEDADDDGEDQEEDDENDDENEDDDNNNNNNNIEADLGLLCLFVLGLHVLGLYAFHLKPVLLCKLHNLLHECLGIFKLLAPAVVRADLKRNGGEVWQMLCSFLCKVLKQLREVLDVNAGHSQRKSLEAWR